MLDRFGAAGAELLLQLAGPGSASRQVLVEVRRLGGAATVPLRGASAFAHRDAPGRA